MIVRLACAAWSGAGPRRVVGTVAGIAITVGLHGGARRLHRSSAAEMTARATAPCRSTGRSSSSPGAIRRHASVTTCEAPPGRPRARRSAMPRATASRPPPAARCRLTGPGKVLGYRPGYAARFPGQSPPALGQAEGVLIAQQTAANLHVAPGDTRHHPSAGPAGRARSRSTASSTCRMPTRCSRRSASRPALRPRRRPTTSCSCPIDHMARARSTRRQMSAPTASACRSTRSSTGRPRQRPAAAFRRVTGEGHNFEARVAGSALLANNLGAILDTAREDALYAARAVPVPWRCPARPRPRF